ncbi:Uma2 family endonuclease [Lusitaniella coriacea LEGE 07157]|uniref:Uma2 family endonuclease n=1 Tax=Lusitaniella coriacea LEGE 07157 TaxID=945747 RepID=A0A8J7B7C7_9CYAN|nr:Uma2 family endonuclease [Lusitaniella coriacea]MBE9115141.1 Uma2 family endonuclease [Lusitaniella coriacea LEGE 07157]
MVQQLPAEVAPTILYPDSDGQPMSDNTKQFRWIVVIKENFELLFAEDADVFVAGDLLWYPVEGNNKLRQAPDAMVVFGRPKGDRGSYKQWEEGNIAPQVVFEVLSPGNRLKAMAHKLQFYDRYGVEEYYVYDPDDVELIGWVRREGQLDVISEMESWVSPRLGVRFEVASDRIIIYRLDGERFYTFVELAQLREQERQRAERESQRAERERQRAEDAIAQLEALKAQLKAKGIELEE